MRHSMDWVCPDRKRMGKKQMKTVTADVAIVGGGPAGMCAALQAPSAGAHLAAAGQGMPPADLTTFVVAGLVSVQFGKKVDPVKSMLYSMPMCICFTAVGIVFMYL